MLMTYSDAKDQGQTSVDRILTYDLQSQVSYRHDPFLVHLQKVEVKDHSVQKLEWKQTDRRTEAIVLPPTLIRSATTLCLKKTRTFLLLR